MRTGEKGFFRRCSQNKQLSIFVSVIYSLTENNFMYSTIPSCLFLVPRGALIYMLVCRFEGSGRCIVLLLRSGKDVSPPSSSASQAVLLPLFHLVRS